MVHNGIEYGDMQMICEAYQVLKDALGLTADELGDIFTEWNKGELDSYLIEITRDILKFKDVDGTPLVEKIKDTAGQVFYSSLFSWLYSRPGSSPPSPSSPHPPSVHLYFMPSPSPRPGHPIEGRSIIATREREKKIHSTNTTTQQNIPKCSFEILILTVFRLFFMSDLQLSESRRELESGLSSPPWTTACPSP